MSLLAEVLLAEEFLVVEVEMVLAESEFLVRKGMILLESVILGRRRRCCSLTLCL